MSSYRLVIHTAQCLSRFAPKYQKAQRFLDSEVLRCSTPYVPYREGELTKSGPLGTVVGSGKVKYVAKHAKRCYYGKHMNFRKTVHPQACAQWFEKSKATSLKSWEGGVNNIIRGG